MSAGTGGRAIESVELRLDAALAATPGVITSTEPTAAVQQSNANGAHLCSGWHGAGYHAQQWIAWCPFNENYVGPTDVSAVTLTMHPAPLSAHRWPGVGVAMAGRGRGADVPGVHLQ